MFAPFDIRFLLDVVVDHRQRQAGDVARVDHRLGTELIAHGYAVPLGAEPLPEARPVRGQFRPRARR